MVVLGLIAEYWLIFLNKVQAALAPKPPDGWLSGAKGDVVFVKGFNATYTNYAKLAEFLNQAGYRIHFVPLQNTHDPVATNSQQIADYITKANLSQVTLIAHSKGCIVSKYLCDTQPKINSKISRVIALCGPFSGTLWGHLRILSLYELIPGSKLIQQINQSQINYSKFHNFYPRIDNHILPNSSLFCPNARSNNRLEIIGHTRILNCQELFTSVLTLLN